MTPTQRKPFHCLVWIDHCIARIFAVTKRELTELTTLHAPDQGRGHIHHHAGTPGPGHESMSEEFLQNVVAALQDPAEILIAGPAQAKQIFKAYLAKKAPTLHQRVVAVATSNKAGDDELRDFACRFFDRIDSIRGSSP
jgi:stalled ribosome rescue protein Dom34